MKARFGLLNHQTACSSGRSVIVICRNRVAVAPPCFSPLNLLPNQRPSIHSLPIKTSMTEPLLPLRALCNTPADAVRWACVLEATAPKAGNVYPGRDFEDLSYADFITAAEIAARQLADRSRSFPQRILDAVLEVRTATGTNVNLGILLLLGPLVAADQSRRCCCPSDWHDGIEQQLVLSSDDSRLIFQAIAAASAGGLGSVDQMDVNDSRFHDDIIAAMQLAKDGDRIARQYAEGFRDLIQHVLPVVYDSMVEVQDMLHGIAVAHIRLLARTPDSLIARKCGQSVAEQVRQAAAEVEVKDATSCLEFDQSLRSGDHQRNPGTTADLIAAALYILLRTGQD